MDLKDIASVAGKSGLFKVLKPTRTGVILETLDGSNKKIIVGANARVSLLKEISIYTTSSESSLMLETVFDTIHKEFKGSLPVSTKDDASALEGFLLKVVPNYDTERVYLSDIKKLVSWYSILSQHAPDLFNVKTEVAEVKEETAATSEKPKKAASTKSKSAVIKDTPAKKPSTVAKKTVTATKSKRGS